MRNRDLGQPDSTVSSRASSSSLAAHAKTSPEEVTVLPEKKDHSKLAPSQPDEANHSIFPPEYVNLLIKYNKSNEFLLASPAERKKINEFILHTEIASTRTDNFKLTLKSIRLLSSLKNKNLIGFNINALNQDGQSALHLAALNYTIVEIDFIYRSLVRHGACQKQKNRAGVTALESYKQIKRDKAKVLRAKSKQEAENIVYRYSIAKFSTVVKCNTSFISPHNNQRMKKPSDDIYHQAEIDTLTLLPTGTNKIQVYSPSTSSPSLTPTPKRQNEAASTHTTTLSSYAAIQQTHSSISAHDVITPTSYNTSPTMIATLAAQQEHKAATLETLLPPPTTTPLASSTLLETLSTTPKQMEISKRRYSNPYFKILEDANRIAKIADAKLSDAYAAIRASATATSTPAATATATATATASVAAAAKEAPNNLAGKWIINNNTANSRALRSSLAFAHIAGVKVKVVDGSICITTPDYRNEKEVKAIYNILLKENILPGEIKGYQRDIEASLEEKLLEEKLEVEKPTYFYNHNAQLTKYGTLVQSINKITSKEKKLALTQQKTEILTGFLEFYHAQISSSQCPLAEIDIIADWVKSYTQLGKEHPLIILAKPRPTFGFMFATTGNTDSIQLVKNLLPKGDKEQQQRLQNIIDRAIGVNTSCISSFKSLLC